MELLKEAVPQAARIAVLWNANDEGMTLRYREIEKAARNLRVECKRSVCAIPTISLPRFPR